MYTRDVDTQVMTCFFSVTVFPTDSQASDVRTLSDKVNKVLVKARSMICKLTNATKVIIGVAKRKVFQFSKRVVIINFCTFNELVPGSVAVFIYRAKTISKRPGSSIVTTVMTVLSQIWNVLRVYAFKLVHFSNLYIHEIDDLLFTDSSCVNCVLSLILTLVDSDRQTWHADTDLEAGTDTDTN